MPGKPITLITPVWNNADTIGDCINSIRSQTQPCQHIVIDGGSSDGTLEKVQQLKLPDTIFVSEPDRGMYDAINKGLALATGEVVGVLNSDDFYASDHVLEKVAQTFCEQSVDACYGDLKYVHKKYTNQVVRNWRAGDYRREKFFAGWMPPHPTFFLRRRQYEEYGGYRLDLGSAADYELMLRMLLKHGLHAVYIPEVLVHMRNDGMSNASLRNRIMANRNDRKAWRVNGITPRRWTLIAKPLGKLGQWFSRGV